MQPQNNITATEPKDLPESPLSTEWFDDKIMQAADGNSEALDSLINALNKTRRDSFPEWPAEVQSAWQNAIEFFLEEVNRDKAINISEFLLTLASTGYDSDNLRDALADVLRTEFSAYADPAGLITATGVYDTSIKTSYIAEYWKRLRVLTAGTYCWHPEHGCGIIKEIDELGGEVKVYFAQLQTFQLHVVLRYFSLLKPASVIDKILKGETVQCNADDTSGNLMDNLMNSFEPPAESIETVKAYLVPELFSEKDFSGLIHKKESGHNIDKTVASKTEPAQETQSPDLITFRSLTELNQKLKNNEPFNPALPENAQRLKQLFKKASARGKCSSDLVEAIARIQGVMDNPEYLAEIMPAKELAELVKNKKTDFIKQLTKQRITIVENWLSAFIDITDEDEFIDFWKDLPLNLLTLGERVAGRKQSYLEKMSETAARTIKKRNGTADLLLWLWKHKGNDAREIRDPALIFATLGKQPHGAFQKAHKALNKMLIEDHDFQDFLTNNGNLNDALKLASAAQHTRALSSADRQAFTVRLAEHYPDVKEAIQKQNTSTVASKKTAPMTSNSSYQKRRQELNDIINKHIPANSRAIAEARSHGDLRENAEYKAAKEEQKILYSKREQLEKDLETVQAVDFRTIEVDDSVIPGAKITLQMEDDSVHQYCVLGLWDSDPDTNCISYNTPLAQALLGSKKGESVTLPSGAKCKITDVERLPENVLAWLDPEE